MAKNRSLLEEYQRIYVKPKLWLYYDTIEIERNFSNRFPTINQILESNDTAKAFVEQYLANGDKAPILNHFGNHEYRYAHIVSTFFLGIYLNKYFKSFPQRNRQFLYLWFLTCLLHDAGYDIENHHNADSIPSLEHFYHHYNIQYKLLDNISRYELDGFSTDLLRNYFSYRLFKHKLDHGICASIILYNALMKKYKEHEELNEHCINLYKQVRNGFIYHANGYELKFSRRHWKLYARCAYAIAQHNVWTPKAESEQLYRDFHLEELIGKKIVYKDRITALLVLCDTIEPVKGLEQIKKNPVTALESVYYVKNVTKQFLQISIPVSNTENNKLKNSILELSSWTNVKVEQQAQSENNQEIFNINQINKLLQQ